MTTTTVEDMALTPREAAQALHLPYKTVLGLIHSGELGSKKVGERRYIVPVAEIDRYLAPAIKTNVA